MKAIINDNDSDEILKLLEIVLGLAVECDKNRECVENIMKLDPSSQKDMMMMIQSSTEKYKSGGSQSTENNLEEDPEFFNELDQRADDVDKLRDENKQLQEDYEVLKKKFDHLASEIVHLNSKCSAFPANDEFPVFFFLSFFLNRMD